MSAHPSISSKIYNLFEGVPSIANREFPLSSQLEAVVRLVYTHYKLQLHCCTVGLH